MTAGVSDFPWLSDIEDGVYDILGSPRTQAGLPPWQPREVTRAFNRAQTWLWGKKSDLDKNWGIKYANVTVTAGVRTADLSNVLASGRSDFRKIHHVCEVDASGAEGSDWTPCTFRDAGKVDRGYVLQRDQKVLWIATLPTSSVTLKVFYNYNPLPLVHGIVRTASLTSIQLADYETASTSEIVGQTLYGFSGTGIGQTPIITAYDGPTRTCTVATMSTAFSTDTRYTSRPVFMVGDREAFLYATVCFLAEKFQDPRLGVFMRQRDLALDASSVEEIRAESAAAIEVDDPLGFTRFEAC